MLEITIIKLEMSIIMLEISITTIVTDMIIKLLF